MTDKKYFSIDEVANIIGIKAHRLRYLEKSAPEIEVFRIRGRRYYTKQNIDQIRKMLNLYENSPHDDESPVLSNQAIVNKIDCLIAKFNVTLSDHRK